MNSNLLKPIIGALAVLALSFAVANLAAAQGTTLSASVSASPSLGDAPLQDVDLSASVSGSATGPITYKFDCTGDGSWERVQTSNNTTYTASDLCDYTNPGAYVAKIEVERGGLAFLGATAVFVRSGSSLSVTLSANPATGSAPLNDVDLTASVVSGSATGNVTYKFDCTGDGSFERTVTSGSTTYTASGLCDYPAQGTYTAKVSVTRDSLTFQGTTSVNVISGSAEFQLEKTGRNLSDGQTSFVSDLAANPSEVLEFQLRLYAGKASADNVILQDTLPAKLVYRGNVKIDGVLSSGNIQSGLNLGSLSLGQTKLVTFQAAVADTGQFAAGTSNVVNTATVFSQNGSGTASMSVAVSKDTPTVVPTGPLDLSIVAIVLTVVALLVASYLFLAKFYFASYLLPLASKKKQQRDFISALKRAKARR